MMTHEQKTRLGIFLVVATVLFVTAVGFFLIPTLREAGDVYFINFRDTSVYGLDVASIVRYQGVQIGKVIRMEVNPKSLDSVIVFIKVQKGFPVKSDMTAFLMYAGITGLKFIDLRGGTPTASRLPPRGEIQTGKGLDAIAGSIVNNVGSAVGRLNDLLSDENRTQITHLLENLEKGTAALSSVLDSRKTQIGHTIDNIDKAAGEFVKATENLKTITANIDELSRKLTVSADAATKNIAQRFSDEEMGRVIKDFDTFVESSSAAVKRIEGILQADQADMSRALEGLTEAMDNLSRFARQLQEDPTALIRARKEKKK